MFKGAAQKSVLLTLGILWHFQAFFWLWVFFCSQALSTPAPAPVTQTVSLREAELCGVKKSVDGGIGSKSEENKVIKTTS
jgi:hypothetical protein